MTADGLRVLAAKFQAIRLLAERTKQDINLMPDTYKRHAVESEQIEAKCADLVDELLAAVHELDQKISV